LSVEPRINVMFLKNHQKLVNKHLFLSFKVSSLSFPERNSEGTQKTHTAIFHPSLRGSSEIFLHKN